MRSIPWFIVCNKMFNLIQEQWRRVEGRGEARRGEEERGGEGGRRGMSGWMNLGLKPQQHSGYAQRWKLGLKSYPKDRISGRGGRSCDPWNCRPACYSLFQGGGRVHLLVVCMVQTCDWNSPIFHLIRTNLNHLRKICVYGAPLPGVLGSWGERPVIVRELGSTCNF